MAKYEVYRSDWAEEWSALYIDGKLDYVGKKYNIDERIAELLGVVQHEGNFLLGGNYYKDCAKTTEEIEAYEQGQRVIANRAQELREQAKKLIEQADALVK